MDKNEDLRVKRTYKLLSNALLQLLRSKSFEEIKVTDICNLAMIHRTTFYTHFEDKYELLKYSVRQTQIELTKNTTSNYNTKDLTSYYINMITTFLKYLKKNHTLYADILSHNHNNVIMDILYETLYKDVKSKLKEDSKSYNKIPINIIIDYYFNAIFYTILNWFKNGMKEKEEKLIEYIIALTNIK